MNSILQLLLAGLLLSGMPTVPSTWRTGLIAVDAETGDTLMSLNARELFRPASTVKLVTTMLALEELGPSYVYRTRILADTSARELWISGAGAPLLSGEHIRITAMETAAALQPGSSWDLLWDSTRFTAESHCPGWEESDWSKTYCPPIEGLSVGDNIVQIVVSTLGGTMRLFHYPPLPRLVIDNGLVIGPTASVRTSVEGWSGPEPALSLSGTVPPDSFVILYKPYPGPPAEFASMFRSELLDRGLEVTEPRPGAPGNPASLVQTSVILSDPLFVILSSMNKWSRNMVADMVLRTVSLEAGNSPASTGAGCDRAAEMLTGLVPGLEGIRLADGSGLSRHNLLAPVHLAAVLMEGTGSLEWGPEFLATLPVNGVDGTLGWRLGNLPPGAFRGKTGTLNDTCAIAGLLTASSGRRIVLVIMLEPPTGYTITARALQDSIVEWFWENY